MKDPTRLLEAGATEAELALLRAGIADQPSDNAQRTLALALGLSANVPTVPAAAPSPRASSAAQLSTKLAVKWFSIVGGTLAVGGALWLQSALQSANQHMTTPHEPFTKPTNLQPSAAWIASPMAAAPSAEALPSAAATPRETAPASAHRAELLKPAAPKSIAHEIALLDSVRVRLAEEQPRAALATLDGYRSQHANGVLRQEATLLRIDALVGMHALPAARKLAQRFLAENPDSPHRNRIRALLDQEPPAP